MFYNRERDSKVMASQSRGVIKRGYLFDKKGILVGGCVLYRHAFVRWAVYTGVRLFSDVRITLFIVWFTH